MPIYTTGGTKLHKACVNWAIFPSSNTHAHSIHFMDFLYKILSMRAFNSPLSCRINSECIHDRVSPLSAMFFRGSNIHGSTLLTAGHFRLLAPTESILIPTGCIPTGAKLYPQNPKGTHTVTVRSGTLTWHEWGLWTKSPNLGNVSHKQGEVTVNLWADTHSQR